MSCADAGQLLEKRLNNELSLAEGLALRLHLFLCGLCRQYQRQAEKIRNMLRRGQSQSPTGLSQEARVRILERLNETKKLEP